MISFFKKHILSKILASDFLRNTLTLGSGTLFAQSISLITAPILYRIYDKEAYGTLGLYMAITGVAGVFSTFQYMQTILLEKEDEDAKRVLWLNRLINIFVALLVALLVFFLNKPIAQYLNNPAIAPWLYLVPISIFFSGQNEIFRVWANRKKKYRILSFNAILNAIIVPVVSISLGIVYKGWMLGLFMGLLTSQIVPPLVMLFTLQRQEDLGKKYLKIRMLRFYMLKHKDFPRFILPASFLNRLSNDIPVFMLSTFAGPGVVGLYNLATRMLILPISLIAQAVREVFRQRATEDFQKTGSCNQIYVKTTKYLAGISILPFILLVVFSPQLFGFVFGNEWYDAGVYCQILCFLYFMKLVVSPLSFVAFITNNLKFGLIMDIVTVIFCFLSFATGLLYYDSVFVALSLFSLSYGGLYFITYYYNYKFSLGHV